MNGQYSPRGPKNIRLTDLWRLGPSEVISLVGAGGKSSLMEALARDYEAEGARVVVTTTTRIRPPTERPFVVVEDAETLARALSEAVTGRGLSPVVGRGLTADGKVEGIPPEWVPALRDLPGVAAVLVEADGSAGLPLKAPADWEPVVPSCSSLVVSVAGLDAQGAILDARYVFRPDLLARLLGVEPGTPVAPQDVLRAAVSGYEPEAPQHAGFIVFLNKADTHEPARALVEACAQTGLEVWCGSVGSAAGSSSRGNRGLRRLGVGDERPSAVIAAAGLGTRMAGQKVTAPLGGGTVVGRVVSAVRDAGGLRETVVVAGSGFADVAAAVAQAETAAPGRGGAVESAAPIRVVRNPAPEAGMSSTLRVGLGALRRPAGVMVLLGDQPLVHPETLRRILELSRESPRAAAVGLAGNGVSYVRPPVLLHRSLLPLVMELHGDQGARHLLAAHVTSVLSVEGAPEEAVDVDRPEDLERVRRIAAASVNSEDDDDAST